MDLFVFAASVPSNSGTVVIETELVVVNGICAYADEISIIPFPNLRRLDNQLLAAPSMAPPFHHSSGHHARTSSSFRSLPLLSTCEERMASRLGRRSTWALDLTWTGNDRVHRKLTWRRAMCVGRFEGLDDATDQGYAERANARGAGR
jgi:hypothetical protein